MKFENTPNGVAIICDKCGKVGPEAPDWRYASKIAVQEFLWTYEWEHGHTHVALFYCPECSALHQPAITAEPVPCLETAVPGSATTMSWIAPPGSAFGPMTRDEFEYRRDDMTPHLRRQLGACLQHEQMILKRLREEPELSSLDKGYLKSAVQSLEHTQSTLHSMFSFFTIPYEWAQN